MPSEAEAGELCIVEDQAAAEGAAPQTGTRTEAPEPYLVPSGTC